MGVTGKGDRHWPLHSNRSWPGLVKHQVHAGLLAARCCPSFACRCPSNRREQGMPDARCTRGLVCEMVQKAAHEHTGQRRTSDIPCARESKGVECVDISTL